MSIEDAATGQWLLAAVVVVACIAFVCLLSSLVKALRERPPAERSDIDNPRSPI